MASRITLRMPTMPMTWCASLMSACINASMLTADGPLKPPRRARGDCNNATPGNSSPRRNAQRPLPRPLRFPLRLNVPPEKQEEAAPPATSQGQPESSKLSSVRKPPRTFTTPRKAERVSMTGTNAYAVLGEQGARRAKVLDLGFGGVALEARFCRGLDRKYSRCSARADSSPSARQSKARLDTAHQSWLSRRLHLRQLDRRSQICQIRLHWRTFDASRIMTIASRPSDAAVIRHCRADRTRWIGDP